jgi:predicted nucleic acid-binding protein
MPYLLDSNILIRLVVTTDPHHEAILHAVESLQAAGESIFITPQNIAAFWNVCTRPTEARGGYGRSSEEA